MKHGRRTFSEVLERRQLLAAVAWDGGGDGTTWLDPLNWSTNALPTAADDVTIDVPGTLTVSLNASTTQQVATLTLREILRLNASTLTVGTFNNGGTLDLASTSTFATTGPAFFTGSPSAVLRTELASATVYGRLKVGTALVLNDPSSFSILQVAPLASFDPAHYVSVQPVTAQTILGTFDSYSGGTTASGKSILLSQKNEETGFFDAGGFEDAAYVVGNDLSTTAPWARSGAASVTGKVGTVAQAGSKGVTLNRPSTVAAFSALREYPNITPSAAPTDRKKMWISWDMKLPTPDPLQTNSYGPFVGMEAYGSLIGGGYTRLAAAGVDAKTGEILWLNGVLNTGTTSTFASFDTWHHFDLVLNYDNNTYAFAMDGTVITQASAIPFQGVPTSLFGDADLTIVQAQVEPPIQPGTAHFDNYNVGWRSNAISATSRQAFALRAVSGTFPAPVLTPSFDFERQQALNIAFDQDVSSSISKEDFVITKISDGSPVSTAGSSFSYDPITRIASLNLQPILDDGDYRLTIPAGAVYSASGSNSSVQTFDFFVLAGDTDRDRDVDFDDLLRLAQNYGKFNQTFSQGNFDYDPSGEADFDDLLLLAQRYGTSLAVAAPAGATPAKSKRRGAIDVVA